MREIGADRAHAFCRGARRAESQVLGVRDHSAPPPRCLTLDRDAP
jgi:hypothetical protein